MSKKTVRIDIGILVCTLLLLGFGIVLVYSSSFPIARRRFGEGDFFLVRQAVRALLGLACFIFFVRLDYHFLGKYANAVLGAALVLLVAVLVMPDSMAVNGAKRWVQIGTFSFQVSDFARIALIIVLTRHLGNAGERIREANVLGKHVGIIALVCVLVVLEPDFSTAVILGTIGFMMLFVAGARFWHICAVVLAGVPAVLLAVATTSYRRLRILGFLNLAQHRQDLGYQSYQALIGLGNGGLFGVGLGGAERKMFYLPEPHTDFVFSILGEEIGFVGLLVVLFIYSFMIYRGIRIAMRASDKMGQCMAAGLTVALGSYVLIHAAVNAGLLPTTGVPLPFLSYGGASLVFTMSAMGILLNISSQTRDMTLPVQRQRPQPRRAAKKTVAGRRMR